VWVDARHIDHYVGKHVVLTGRTDDVLRHTPLRLRRWAPLRQLLRTLRPKDPPFVIPDHRYRRPVRLDDLEKYLMVKDLVERDGAYQQSRWFASLHADVERDGRARHKDVEMRSVAEVHAFFEAYVLPLIDSMRRSGYDLKRGAQLGQALIGADGRLHKANNGDHRFFVARIVGTESFPLRIAGAHEAWVRQVGLDARLADADRLAAAIRDVERDHR